MTDTGDMLLLKLTERGEEAVGLLMLRQAARVRSWVEAGDMRAQPYFDVDAIRFGPHDEFSFHKERFLDTWVKQGINEEDLY